MATLASEAGTGVEETTLAAAGLRVVVEEVETAGLETALPAKTPR